MDCNVILGNNNNECLSPLGPSGAVITPIRQCLPSNCSSELDAQWISRTSSSYSDEVNSQDSCSQSGSARVPCDQVRKQESASSMSSSYSGIVLGTDLDLLQYDYRVFNHSQYSVVSTASHTEGHPSNPDMTSRQYDSPAVMPQIPGLKLSQQQTKVVTSAALPALLSIALDNGLVKPDHTKPHLSFHSPTGTIISIEDVSRQADPDLALTVLTYNCCARPVQLASTTKPVSFAPLPAFFKRQLGKRRRISTCTHQQISDLPNHAQSYTDVVQEQCTQQCQLDTTQHISKKRKLHSLLSACHKRPTSKQTEDLNLPKTLDKTNQTNPSPPSHISKINIRGKTQTQPIKDAPNLSAHAARALRVCFCQPYDGAGKQNLACMSSNQRDEHAEDDSIARDDMENVRVVRVERRSTYRHSHSHSHSHGSR